MLCCVMNGFHKLILHLWTGPYTEPVQCNDASTKKFVVDVVGQYTVRLQVIQYVSVLTASYIV